MMHFINIARRNESPVRFVAPFESFILSSRDARRYLRSLRSFRRKSLFSWELKTLGSEPSKNMLFDAFPFMGKFTEAGIFAAQKKYDLTREENL